MYPVRRTDRYVSGITSRAPTKLRIADCYQSTFLGNLIQIGDTFSLGVTVAQQPSFAFKVRCRVRIQRLVAMKQDLSLQMKELKRSQRDTREIGVRCQSGIGPLL